MSRIQLKNCQPYRKEKHIRIGGWQGINRKKLRNDSDDRIAREDFVTVIKSTCSRK